MMHEAMPRPSGAEEREAGRNATVQNVEVEDVALAEKLEALMQRSETLKAKYKDLISGGSSFFDVTGNLGSIAKRYLAYWREEHNEEDRTILENNLAYLERYLDDLGLIEHNPDLITKELTDRNGAFPESREAADAAQANGGVKKPIFFYIDEMDKRVRPTDA